jgi:phosphoribosylglycinamide formyltransferase-1
MTACVDPTGISREQFDQRLSDILRQHDVNLVVLIGYMRILSDAFVQAWEKHIINVHPSLLPAFAGKMDKEVHKAVLASGVKETGCTVHYVTPQLDAGPIILQKKCPVLPDDTIDSLKQRVQDLEGLALVEAVEVIAKHNAQ